ncbi:hypothetical protein U1Q18_019301, partial [Sarracenia purpurea var. burkii]
ETMSAIGNVAEAIAKTTSTSGWVIGGVLVAIAKTLSLCASGRPASSLKRPLEMRSRRAGVARAEEDGEQRRGV